MKKFFSLIIIIALVFGAYFVLKVVSFDPSNDTYTLSTELYQQVKAQNPNYLTLDQVSPDFLEILVYIEDKRFYKHFGFDLISIAKAVKRNVAAKTFEAGGSTLSQQLAKNLFYSREKTLERKAYELWTAIELERLFTKDQILEMYINVIYYGSDAYGISSASKVYFDKTPDGLTIEESAMLVGIIPAPSLYNPITNSELASQRQAQVLKTFKNR